MGCQFVLAASVEILATIGIMASVTWQVLFVGVFAIVLSKYVQVSLVTSTHTPKSMFYQYVLSEIMLFDEGILSKICG